MVDTTCSLSAVVRFFHHRNDDNTGCLVYDDQCFYTCASTPDAMFQSEIGGFQDL